MRLLPATVRLSKTFYSNNWEEDTELYSFYKCPHCAKEVCCARSQSPDLGMHFTPVTTTASGQTEHDPTTACGYWCDVHTQISRLGTRLSAKLRFVARGVGLYPVLLKALMPLRAWETEFPRHLHSQSGDWERAQKTFSSCTQRDRPLRFLLHNLRNLRNLRITSSPLPNP